MLATLRRGLAVNGPRRQQKVNLQQAIIYLWQVATTKRMYGNTGKLPRDKWDFGGLPPAIQLMRNAANAACANPACANAAKTRHGE